MKEKKVKLKLEFQYFEDCPNHTKMLYNIYEAIEGLDENIEIKKVLVDDELVAKLIKFRGSPTLLIDDEDLLGMPIPDQPSLVCRYYPNGIPTSAEIRNAILQKINEEN